MFNSLKDKTNKLIKKAINTDDSHEFKPLLSEIEDAPMSPLGRFTFWTIVALITVTTLWLIIGKVDIVVSAKGIVIPDGEAKIVQPLDSGVISRIIAKEGDFVKKGQILMEIDPASTAPELESVKKNLNDTNLEIQRLGATTEGKAFTPDLDSQSARVQQNIYDANFSSLQNQLEVKRLELSKIDDELKSNKAERATNQSLLLSAQNKEKRLKNVLDVIAYDDYEEVVNKIKGYKAEIIKLNYKISELISQKGQTLSEISTIQADFNSKNLEQLADKTKKANELQASADQITFKNTKQRIASPCDGYVDKLFIHTVGGVVTPAQQLFAVTPYNTPLMIKATVNNQDIGFIREGMPVSVKIDTFSFQKYGMIKGEVKSISKNSIKDEKLGPIYEVYVTPITKTLMVEGREQSIRTGMTLKAEIKVGKRRIIEFFIYPLIKYLDEGMSVR